ncbi:MAG TPA: hypothetical protein VFR63_12555 [Gaiellaceae bacterium]|nr:hypothetical protein [Gaiellaceae bacterium]
MDERFPAEASERAEPVGEPSHPVTVANVDETLAVRRLRRWLRGTFGEEAEGVREADRPDG